jgi:hypothetical protein
MACLIRHAVEHAATRERQMAADANRRPDFPTVDFDGVEAAGPEAVAEMQCLCTEALAALYPHSSPKTEWFRVLKTEWFRVVSCGFVWFRVVSCSQGAPLWRADELECGSGGWDGGWQLGAPIGF